MSIPNVQNATMPIGFAEHQALPAIREADWEQLDDYEAQLRGMASYIDSMKADVLEVEKALRIVEARRGEILGMAVTQGARTDLSMHEKVEDVSAPTASRYRKIARAWEDVWPHIVQASRRSDVTQAAILRLIDNLAGVSAPAENAPAPAPAPSAPVSPPAPPAESAPQEEEEQWDEINLLAELEFLQANNTELQERVEVLQQDDKTMALAKLMDKNKALTQRVDVLTRDCKEREAQAKAANKRLQQIAKLLKVEDWKDIVPAIKELQRMQGAGHEGD
jgi:hypothetical protein